MQLLDGKPRFSPSDLTNFMESRFVSYMDRLYLIGDERAKKDPVDEGMSILRERGLAHEAAYLNLLRESGVDVAVIEADGTNGIDLTQQSMREGRQVIYQAHLAHGEFFGKADFLVRVDGHHSPALGTDYVYEPLDTKLALTPKPYFAIQLCCYAEMLASIQGILPESFFIVLGNGSSKSFRTEDFYYFYRQLKCEFLDYHLSFNIDEIPEFIELPPFCSYREVGKEILEKRDDLSRVANIRKSNIIKFKKAGITTLADLAQSEQHKILGMSDETFDNLKQQALLQLRSSNLPKPLFEIIEPRPDDFRRGLALLPPRSQNDVWFDMEGYPHVEGGLEYLFGASYLEHDELKFFECWAHDEVQEKRAFEEFVDWVFSRFMQDPDMHIYHYAAYEQTALRRLMGKFGSREAEIDQLLRHNVFIDLFTIVRQAIRVGEPSYSIKNIEHLYRGMRTGEVSTALDSVVSYYKWLECRDGEDAQSSSLLASIRDYNKEDCDSTYELCTWLLALQKERAEFAYIKAPEPGDSAEQEDETSILAKQVLELHGDGALPTILSQLLHFHKREDKPIWWAIFDKRSWSSDELFGDLESIAELTATTRWNETIGKSKLYEFAFDPDQETKIDIGDSVCFFLADGGFANMTVKELDLDNGRIGLSSMKVTPPRRMDIVKKDLTGIPTIRNSIFRLVSEYCQGIDLPPAIAQFLERGAPRIKDHVDGQPIISRPNESLLPQVIDVIKRLDGSTLCIQGPPGCGKTYTSAHAILALLSDGMRVGITSNSHKAIELLLHTVAEIALTQGVSLDGAKIGMDSKEREPPIFKHPGIVYKSDAGKALGKYQLVGGTAFAFSREEATDTLDYLFVDEAGQVCLANLVGMCRSAKNIILLGDQMQLDQPIRGAHPGDSGLSTLQYYLEDYSATPPDMGILLSVTRRLPPDLCSFISSAVYAGRLTNSANTAERKLINRVPRQIVRDTGLLFVPVKHQGCVQSSEEEATKILELIDELKTCHLSIDGTTVPFVPLDHILIVAPYNKQVRLLKRLLPGIEIGTVDKFQGKEKPVVIVSMAESDLSESARGIEFLLSKNRLNVALSRAQVLAIVVANSSLAYVDCGSLKSMSLVNLFSRIVQYGSTAREPRVETAPLPVIEPAAFEQELKVEMAPSVVPMQRGPYGAGQEKAKLELIIDFLSLPANARVDQRVPKTKLMERGAKTAADKRLIQEEIEELTWIASLESANIGVPSFQNVEREYLEIIILSLVLRGGTKLPRISELIHRSIPNPVLLIAKHGVSASVSLAHKRWSQDHSKVLIDNVRRADILHPESPTSLETDFLKSLSLPGLPCLDLFATYQGMIERIMAFEAAKIFGKFILPDSSQRMTTIATALETYTRLRSALNTLRSKMAREKQFNRRVLLNTEIKRIENELATIAAGLASQETDL